MALLRAVKRPLSPRMIDRSDAIIMRSFVSVSSRNGREVLSPRFLLRNGHRRELTRNEPQIFGNLGRAAVGEW